jgi:uncharacterized delta-60 repeat protein
MNARKVPIIAALVALLVVLATVGAAAAAAPGVGLDTSYGKEGVVTLNPERAEGEEESAYESGPLGTALGFAAATDGSAYVMANLRGCRGDCRNGPYVARFDPSGKADDRFGGEGRLELPTGDNNYTVGVDAAGRVLVAYVKGAAIVFRRFGPDGKADRGFGKGGTKIEHCECGGGYRQFRWVRSPKGRMLFVADRALPSREGGGTQFEIFRFLPGGGLDPAFGKAGRLTFVSPHSELAREVVVAPSGAILLGGSPCCGPRQIFLERVGPAGRPDRAFDRVAASSVRRLTALGEFPSLGALAPTADGGLVALGDSEDRGGFYLRLRRDGHLDRSFGKRGLVRLPFRVDAAAPGTDGAIFVVGEPAPYGGYHAFRLLANARPDPAYNGAKGIRVPLSGGPARVTPISPGRMLVTDKGDYECIRQCTPAEPGLVRFLE